MEGKSKIFICSHDSCSAVFSRGYRLQIHMRTHTGERPFVCSYDDCDKSYVRSSHLNRHEATHEEKDLRCSFDGCSAVLKNSATLKKHVKNKHLNVKNKLYKCSYCDKEFSKRSWVKAHEYEHTGMKPHVCPKDDCGRSFLTPSRLKRHMKVHEGYKCLRDGCEVTCLTWNLYLKHMKVTHLPVHKCDVCSKDFSTLWNLEMHKKIHLDLSERPLFFCPVPNCLRSYTEERNMKYHVKKYHEQRPFHCAHNGCALSFKNEDQLKKHSQVHDPNVPFPSKKRKKKLKQRKKAKLSFAATLAGYKNEEDMKTDFKNHCSTCTVSTKLEIQKAESERTSSFEENCNQATGCDNVNSPVCNVNCDKTLSVTYNNISQIASSGSIYEDTAIITPGENSVIC